MIDNIIGVFKSDDLASVLTSPDADIRIKGLSKVVDVPVGHPSGCSTVTTSPWTATLAQRVIMCHLQHEDAGTRGPRRISHTENVGVPSRSCCGQDRAKYMQACLDLICAWVNDGAPKRKRLVLAKYGDWESVIGGIIDWIAPEVKFLADHQRETLNVDSERDDTITFLKHLMIAFPGCDTNAIGVSQDLSKVFPDFGGKSTLRDFVPDGLFGVDGSSFAKRLGRWLKKVSTRRWGTITLVPVRERERESANVYGNIKLAKRSRRHRNRRGYSRGPRRRQRDC